MPSLSDLSKTPRLVTRNKWHDGPAVGDEKENVGGVAASGNRRLRLMTLKWVTQFNFSSTGPSQPHPAANLTVILSYFPLLPWDLRLLPVRRLDLHSFTCAQSSRHSPQSQPNTQIPSTIATTPNLRLQFLQDAYVRFSDIFSHLLHVYQRSH